MSIQRAPDGSITAVIRNPEFNQFRRNVYRVETRDRRVTFADAKNSGENFEGKLNGDRLTVQLPNLDNEVQFTRLKPEEAAGFFPRVPRGQNYIYERPVSANDGWTTASLSDVGLDSGPISESIEKILHVDPTNNALNFTAC
jgi:hypothetical protein